MVGRGAKEREDRPLDRSGWGKDVKREGASSQSLDV